MMIRALPIAATLAFTAGVLAQPYDVTIQPATSSATWSFNLAAPFQTAPSGTCNFLGSYDAATNPGGTRTLPGIFGGNTSSNTPVPITSGSVSASASSGTTPLNPAATFSINLDPSDNLCSISNFDADILNGQTASSTATFAISFGTFRTFVPTCLVPGIPLNLPIGTIVVSGLTATQDSLSAGGVLTPAGGSSYTFSVPLTASVQVTATLDGEDFPVDPVPIAFVLSGTITPAGATATVSANIAINQADAQPGTPLDPLPFVEPICGGNLNVTIVLASVNTTTVINASLNGNGVSPAPSCDGDVNCDFALDGFDVETQEKAVGGDSTDYCQSDPDFNGDFALDGFDVEAVEQVVGGGPCP